MKGNRRHRAGLCLVFVFYLVKPARWAGVVLLNGCVHLRVHLIFLQIFIHLKIGNHFLEQTLTEWMIDMDVNTDRKIQTQQVCCSLTLRREHPRYAGQPQEPRDPSGKYKP